MGIKECSKCHIPKPLNEFYRLASSRDGYRPDCKTCRRVQDQARWHRDRENIIARNRARYYAGNTHIHRLPEVERFWSKVQKNDTSDGCWLWMGSKSPSGYGMFHRKPFVSAHRFAWITIYGIIPDGMNVLHQCDNPACVRPEHLFLGTQGDNVRDMMRKGRWTSYHGRVYPNARVPQGNTPPPNPPCQKFPKRPNLTDEERFWERVDRSGGPNACWPWIAGMAQGYGVLSVNGISVRAHRFSYVLHHGAPLGLGKLWVLHQCHNPACVNPQHLRLGTPCENSREKVQSNRHRPLFSPDDILAIRATQGTRRASQVAAHYGVRADTIRNIWRRKTWKHIP